MNVVACPSCAQQLKYTSQQAGYKVQCPGCQATVVLRAKTHTVSQSSPDSQSSPAALTSNPSRQPALGGNPTMDPLLGQQFDPLVAAGQLPAPQASAPSSSTHPVPYPKTEVDKQQRGIQPVVLWSSIGGGVLVVAIVAAVFLLGMGQPSLEKIPVPEYFTKAEPTDWEKDFYDNQLMVYECDDKHLGELDAWFNEQVPKTGIWRDGGPTGGSTGNPGQMLFIHRNLNSPHDLHITTEKVDPNKLRVIFWLPLD